MIIGYAYVVGDILHVGHLLHLSNCKQLCDKLIVGVLTDEAAMEKKDRPSVPFEQRIKLVAALECVDAVVAQSRYLPSQNIYNIKPDILFECDGHEQTSYPFFEIDHGGRIITMPYYPEQSSTHIKEIIRGS